MSCQVKTKRLTLVTVRVHLHPRMRVSRQSLVWAGVGVHLCAQKHMVRQGTNPRDDVQPARHHIHACLSDVDLAGWILALLFFPPFITPCLGWCMQHPSFAPSTTSFVIYPLISVLGNRAERFRVRVRFLSSFHLYHDRIFTRRLLVSMDGIHLRTQSSHNQHILPHPRTTSAQSITTNLIYRY
jgi:hypothetical protein